MARSKEVFVCQGCGSSSPKWQGQCAACGEWNTLVAELQGSGRAARGAVRAARSSPSTSLAEQASIEDAKLAILVSCIGRKLLLGQRIADEVEAVAEVLGTTCRTTGFYSYGEIAPMEGLPYCDLHNQTMTITTFAEG